MWITMFMFDLTSSLSDGQALDPVDKTSGVSQEALICHLFRAVATVGKSPNDVVVPHRCG
jgi:hypothetical protein